MGACHSNSLGEGGVDFNNIPVFKKNNGHILTEYRIVKTVSERPDIVVFDATSTRSKAPMIVKKYRLCMVKRERVLNELSIHAEMDHPCVYKFIEYFQTDNEIYCIHEITNSPRLIDYIVSGKYTARDSVGIVKALVSFLDYVRDKSIFFGGVNLKNLFYDGVSLRFCNFSNSARYVKKQKLSGHPYEVAYKAPEVLQGKFTHKADIWALGVLSYILFTGNFPFKALRDEENEERIRSGKLDLSEVKNPLQRAFIQRCMKMNYKERPKPYELAEDPLFKDASGSDAAIPPEMFSNINDFNKRSRFARAFYNIMIDHLVSENDKKELFGAFHKIDRNGDGQLSFEEFKNATKLSIPEISEDGVEELFDQVDRNKNGVIEWSEYVEAFIDRKKVLSKDRIRACFELARNETSGKINVKSLENLFGEEAYSNFVERGIKKYGKQEEISYEQFEAMMNDFSKEGVKEKIDSS